ncbi:caspase domain-containing protein [Gloeopeniophorella convolvens]|nr:caspase domain-containing protein [Gloeopeniophorella convolvens]
MALTATSTGFGTFSSVRPHRHLGSISPSYNYLLPLPGLLQPTRENMIRELKRLVSDASSGDKFTFLYSGHSDQQPAGGDPDEEEDGQDEVIITSDEQRIIDNILVMPLPVDCSLLAILDTCHSGTMLDLPHHHCNNVYVPWQSKGERRTQTMLNKNVRGGAYGVVVGCNDQLVHPPPSISSVMSPRHFTDPAVAFPTLRIDTKLGEGSSMDQRALSAGAHPRGVPGSAPRSYRRCSATRLCHACRATGGANPSLIYSPL